jgi:hypothetical protein
MLTQTVFSEVLQATCLVNGTLADPLTIGQLGVWYFLMFFQWDFLKVFRIFIKGEG